MKPIEYASGEFPPKDKKEILNGIPTKDLSRVVADFESEGAIVEATSEGNGKWTITAAFKLTR